MARRWGSQKQKTMKLLIQVSLFLLLVNLPFFTMISLVGTDTFIDTFIHHEEYTYYPSYILSNQATNHTYILIQKTVHPDFAIMPGDEILYMQDEGSLACRPISSIYQQNTFNKYYTITFQEHHEKETIFDYQIIGKVIGQLQRNIWNDFSIKIWDLSINNANTVALLTDI